MPSRLTRGAGAAALVVASTLALTSVPAVASADAARSKAPSRIRVAALVYDPIGSQGIGFTEYTLVVTLNRHGKPYAGKRVCDKIRIGHTKKFLLGPCRRTDAAGHASFPVGSSGKATYYVFFKGDRKTRATTKTYILHGHMVPKA